DRVRSALSATFDRDAARALGGLPGEGVLRQPARVHTASVEAPHAPLICAQTSFVASRVAREAKLLPPVRATARVARAILRASIAVPRRMRAPAPSGAATSRKRAPLR